MALQDCDVVCHLIGSTVPQSSNGNPRYDIEANLAPTLTLFDLCRQYGIRHLIFASSGGTIYGIPQYVPIDEAHETKPICSYGIQKLAIEHYMRLYHSLYGIDMTALRLSNVYGPRQNTARAQGVIGAYCSRVAHGEALDMWGDGTVVRDFMYIADVVEAIKMVMRHAPGFQVFNLGTGIGTSLNDLIDHLRVVSPVAFTVRHLPGRAVDVSVNILDCTKFQQAFPWKARYSLMEGLRPTLDWFMTQRPQQGLVQ